MTGQAGKLTAWAAGGVVVLALGFLAGSRLSGAPQGGASASPGVPTLGGASSLQGAPPPPSRHTADPAAKGAPGVGIADLRSPPPALPGAHALAAGALAAGVPGAPAPGGPMPGAPGIAGSMPGAGAAAPGAPNAAAGDADDPTLPHRLVILKPASTPIPYSPMVHSLHPLDARVAAPAPDDLSFARSFVARLADNEHSVQDDIDWAHLRANGNDDFKVYARLADPDQARYRDTFVRDFWAPLQTAGLSYQSFSNFHIVSPGKARATIAFDDNAGHESRIVVEHSGARRLVSMVQIVP